MICRAQLWAKVLGYTSMFFISFFNLPLESETIYVWQVGLRHQSYVFPSLRTGCGILLKLEIKAGNLLKSPFSRLCKVTVPWKHRVRNLEGMKRSPGLKIFEETCEIVPQVCPSNYGLDLEIERKLLFFFSWQLFLVLGFQLLESILLIFIYLYLLELI